MAFRCVFSACPRNLLFIPRISRPLIRFYAKNQPTEITDEPIKYSTSDAAKWKAIYSTRGEDYYTTPKIQSTAIMLSLIAFMVYFCMLREENDLDDWLRDIEKQVPLQIEEGKLRAAIEQRKKSKTDSTYEEQRLEEILKQKAQIFANK
ncbi:uncharacterized protein LOC118200012 [Stegodyphus dumicola]|uniref:uncharacterized protein LOC118200012 n=1 Tax=Stegodyphus dumicola TaxID=202533 RepID=UPI0015AB5F54|nr:uncharacterized protein LOC118200012 [Stegodyphus dumicola]